MGRQLVECSRVRWLEAQDLSNRVSLCHGKFLFRYLVSVGLKEGFLLPLQPGEQGAQFADLGSGTPFEGVPGTAVLSGVGAWASGVFPRFPPVNSLRSVATLPSQPRACRSGVTR